MVSSCCGPGENIQTVAWGEHSTPSVVGSRAESGLGLDREEWGELKKESEGFRTLSEPLCAPQKAICLLLEHVMVRSLLFGLASSRRQIVSSEL